MTDIFNKNLITFFKYFTTDLERKEIYFLQPVPCYDLTKSRLINNNCFIKYKLNQNWWTHFFWITWTFETQIFDLQQQLPDFIRFWALIPCCNKVFQKLQNCMTKKNMFIGSENQWKFYFFNQKVIQGKKYRTNS